MVEKQDKCFIANFLLNPMVTELWISQTFGNVTNIKYCWSFLTHSVCFLITADMNCDYVMLFIMHCILHCLVAEYANQLSITRMTTVKLIQNLPQFVIECLQQLFDNSRKYIIYYCDFISPFVCLYLDELLHITNFSV